MRRWLSIAAALAGLTVALVGAETRQAAQRLPARSGGADANIALLAGGPPGPVATQFSPGLVSSVLTDWGLTLAPDGAEAFYTVSVEKRSAIVSVRLAGDHWTAPAVAPFSGVHRDVSPTLSRDGRRMVFASDRPLAEGSTRKDTNLWMVERRNGAWGEPVPLQALATEGHEIFPFLHASGDLYFNRADEQRKERVFVSRFSNGTYQAAEPVRGALLTPYGECCPFVSPDGRYMIVELVDAPGGLGGGDLHVSWRQPDGTWGAPRNLGATVNSPAHDCYPVLSPGGRYLVFMSSRTPSWPSEGGRVSYLDLLWRAAKPAPEPFDFYWIEVAKVPGLAGPAEGGRP